MTKKIKKFTVYKDRWLRGGMAPDGYYSDTFMCDDTGNMCCLGFAANQISRKKRAQLVGARVPQDVYVTKSFLTCDEGYNNELADLAVSINDDGFTSDDQKIEELTKLFKDNGIEVEFV